MNKKTRKITVVTFCLLMLFGIIMVPQASIADEITVSGNGANSSSNINITTANQTNSQQSNTAQVNNNTNATATTGKNTAANNSGGTATIQSGNANVTSTVSNAANTSSVDASCCSTQQHTTATITGNGGNSSNTIDVSSTNKTTVTVNQNADISNTVSQKAITGNNNANNNTNNVNIKTGDITGVITVTTGPVNSSKVKVSTNAYGSINVKIGGNGEGANNAININSNNITNIVIANAAAIITHLQKTYLTGGNSANYNTGEVNIVTGSISGIVNITNGPINSSSVTCLQKEKSQPTPPPAPQPTSSSSPSSSAAPSSTSTSSSGSSSGGSGSVLGASANNLPVTGSYWFFIAVIGNILMMLLGAYLRLRSGRSPAFAAAI